MKTLNDEDYVLEHYRKIPKYQIKYFGNFFRCWRVEILTKSILFRLFWKDSSSKSALPPDFHNDFNHIMMDVMRIDDGIGKIKGKHVPNSFERANKALKRIFGKKWKEQEVTLFYSVDTSNPDEFNFKGYLKNFERVIMDHSNKVVNYHRNYPKCKTTVFLLCDESNNYVELSDPKELEQSGNKHYQLHNVRPHICYADKEFLDIIKKCEADYVIWMGYYKPYFGNDKRPKLPFACIYDVKHIKRKGIVYNHDLMFKI